MARLDELSPELVLHIVSFLIREMIMDGPFRGRTTRNTLLSFFRLQKMDFVPDFSSVNAFSQTNTVFHHTINPTLYKLCASVEFVGRRALLFAVEHNSEAVFDKLVAAGVSVDGKFKYQFLFAEPDESLLHIAAGLGKTLIVSKLLQMHGSEMPERLYAHGDKNMSALDYAVLGKHMETIKFLAPMTILAASSSSPIAVDVSGERIQAHKKYLGQALVKCASQGGDIAICKYLLSEGADVNTLDNDGMRSSSLGYVMDKGNLAMMQLLLAAGADPNLGDRDSVVPLFKAGSVPAAQTLLDAGARIHATDNAGRNALTYRGLVRDEMLQFFLERGVDPNHADDVGWTPLHYACQEWKEGVAAIELLIQFGATTAEKADRNGRTPVDLAMQMDNIKAVRLLEPFIQDPALKAKIAEWLKENGGPEDTGPTI